MNRKDILRDYEETQIKADARASLHTDTVGMTVELHNGTKHAGPVTAITENGTRYDIACQYARRTVIINLADIKSGGTFNL